MEGKTLVTGGLEIARLERVPEWTLSPTAYIHPYFQLNLKQIKPVNLYFL
jgi:hypothetical protein